MTEELGWIERWPLNSPDGRRSITLASSTDQRIVDAAWRAAQVLGIGPKITLHNQRLVVQTWEPVRFSGKR